MRDKNHLAMLRFKKQKRLNLLAESGVHDFIIVLDNLKPIFNVGKIFRSTDAFGACEVHLIGIDFFDPAPATGYFKKVPARFHYDFESCYQDLISRGYLLFTMEPTGGESLPLSKLPGRSAFIFGHEELCISFNKKDYKGIESITIPQLLN